MIPALALRVIHAPVQIGTTVLFLGDDCAGRTQQKPGLRERSFRQVGVGGLKSGIETGKGNQIGVLNAKLPTTIQL
jgi:hypothetical protein